MKRGIVTYILLVLLAVMAGSRETYAYMPASLDAAFSNDDMPLGLRYTKKHPLIVAADWSFFPYSYYNDDGVAEGYEIDIIHEIFDVIHIPYEIRMMDWNNVKENVREGKAHLMLDLKKYDGDFSLLYGSTSFGEYKVAMATQKGDGKAMRICDVPQYDTVFIRKGDYTDDMLRRKTVAVKCHIAFMEPAEALRGIAKGTVKYYVWGYESLRQMLRTMRGGDNIQLNVVEDIPAGKFHFRSTDRRLLAELDYQFERIQQSGHYDMVNEKWKSHNVEVKRAESWIHKHLFPIVFFSLLLVITAICLIFIFRMGRLSSTLRREFVAITDMVIAAHPCQVAALDVRKMYIHNVRGIIIPFDGLSLNEFEARVHPDDILEEYALRNAIYNGEKDISDAEFRIMTGFKKQYVKVHVSVAVREKSKGRPHFVFLVMQEVNAS